MIKIGSNEITLNVFKKILIEKQTVELDIGALKKVENNYNFLKRFVKDKVIYGINTGFGPMAQYLIDEDKLIELQYN